MTSDHSYRHPFACRPGVDGTESTFDIVYLPTDTVIAAFTYWDAKAHCKRAARTFVKAMNQLHAYGAFVYHDGWAAVGALIDGSKSQNFQTEEDL